MTEQREMRILVLVPFEMQGEIRRQLTPLGVMIDFISKATDLSQLTLSRALYQVVLLPAALPGNGWWSLWERSLCSIRGRRFWFMLVRQASSYGREYWKWGATT